MKKNCLQVLCSLLFAILVAGCKKDMQYPDIKVVQKVEKSGNGHKKECRLIHEVNDFGENIYRYDHKGLLDELRAAGYDGYFKMGYDRKGKLVNSKFYSQDVLINTVKFFYKDNRLIKETWYNGDTEEIVDEVFYYYNREEQVIKTASVLGDYFTSYKYDRDGNVLKWLFSIGDGPLYAAEYTYHNRHKNPYAAVPGFEYGFPFINGALMRNKWFATSEKFISYDESGNPSVEYDQDPRKTIVVVNSTNYILRSDFWDKLARSYTHYSFVYENCKGDDQQNGWFAQKYPGGKHTNKSIKFLRKGSASDIKEQVKALRNQKRTQPGNIKNN